MNADHARDIEQRIAERALLLHSGPPAEGYRLPDSALDRAAIAGCTQGIAAAVAAMAVIAIVATVAFLVLIGSTRAEPAPVLTTALPDLVCLHRALTGRCERSHP